MTPLVYHYHPDTQVYLGFTEAIESPLEPGVYLCPAHATLNSPALEIVESQVNVWNHTNKVWTQQERFPPTSHTHIYSIPEEQEPIQEEPILEEAIMEEPILEETVMIEPIDEEPVPRKPFPDDPIAEEPIPDIMTQLRWFRDYHLEKVDWVAIKYFTMGLPYPAEWATYVQALRDLPTTSKELAVDENGRLLEASIVLPTRPTEPK